MPRVAHTKHGTSPAARSAAISCSNASARMANDASWGTVRIRSVPKPAMRNPFSMLEWACDVA